MSENTAMDLGFHCHDLGAGYSLRAGRLPDSLVLQAAAFEELWQMHPAAFHEIRMHGRRVRTPRWQQAYGMDYFFTGCVNRALPVPPLLAPLLVWSRKHVDYRLNGLLVNWYDGQLGHYIGRHRDSIRDMAPGAPIVTISFGEERIFRLRAWPARKEAGSIDFPARHGSVFIMPWETNRAFTHEVPRSSRLTGRRISVTLRAFLPGRNESKSRAQHGAGLRRLD